MDNLLNKTKRSLTDWLVKNNAVCGTKLPSERDFALMFKVSKITVTNAFSALEKEGVIEKIPRRGTYVKTALKQPFMVDVYLEEEWKEPILSFNHKHHSYFVFREFLDGIWSASSDFNMSICVEFINRQNPLMSVKRSLFRDGALFVNTTWPGEFKEMLYEQGIPFVMVATGGSGFKNSVGIRHTGLINGLEELFRLGHREFGLLAHWTKEDYIRDFQNWLKSKGIRGRPEWLLPFDNERTDEESSPVVEKYLRQKELPTAIISTSPIHTRPLFSICGKLGIRIPEDMSVMHTGEAHSVDCLNKKVSLDYPGFFKVARESMRRLHGLLENKGGSFDEELLDSEYIPGETFAKPREQRRTR